MNANQLTQEELAEALLRSVNLTHELRAATHLLIRHGYWLRRMEFWAAIDVEVESGLIYADVNWSTARQLVDTLNASASESSILRFACLLSATPVDGVRDLWSLREILWGLDRDGTTAAITAFASAATGGRA